MSHRAGRPRAGMRLREAAVLVAFTIVLSWAFGWIFVTVARSWLG